MSAIGELDDRIRDQQPIAPSRVMEEPGGAAGQRGDLRRGHHLRPGFLHRYINPTPGTYLRGRGGGIGNGMPGTVGMQVALPDRPVVGVVADGSSMYNITALWTAAHHKLPVTWVILSNRTYRILKVNMLNYLGEAAAGREFVEMDFTDPVIDFAGLAKSLGCHGRRVEKPDELGEALREAIAHPGPALVDVVIDATIPGRG
ncbi:MAG: thiamine pyrophosphate-dependent enzyme [Dehalococcoidia bacterium]